MTITMQDIGNKIVERIRGKAPCLKHKGQLCLGTPFSECGPCIREIIEKEREDDTRR